MSVCVQLCRMVRVVDRVSRGGGVRALSDKVSRRRMC